MNRDLVRRRMAAWAQILRLPNLLTVPGDPMAGFFLAGAGPWTRLAAALFASLFFYAGGLLLNDVFDVETDRRERPYRPLPSGRLSRKTVSWIAALFLAVGLGCCVRLGRAGWAAGLSLALALLFYDAGGKARPLAGPLLMGLCRALSLLLGAAAAAPHAAGVLPFAAAGVVLLYILSVTRLARREMDPGPLGRVKSWPAGLLAGGGVVFGALVFRLDTGRPAWFLLPWLLALASAFAVAVRLGASPARHDRPAAIGQLLRALLPLQAAFLLASTSGSRAGLLLLALWPISGILGRRVAMS